MRYLALILMLSVAAPPQGRAQSSDRELDLWSDTVLLRPVQIQTAAPGVQSVPSGVSTATNYEDLATVLRVSASTGWKVYGPGQLATPSLRGTAGRHTRVIWNGLDISSPLSGVTDFSLMPFTPQADVQIRTGSNAEPAWSNTAGGYVQIKSAPVPLGDKGVRAELSGGHASFDTWQGRALLELSGNNWFSRTWLMQLSSEADFPVNHPGLEGERREHAAFRTQQFSQESGWDHRSGSWRLSLLGVHADRDLPAPIFASANEETQQDRRYMGALNWSRMQGNWLLRASTGIVQDRIVYENPVSDISSDNLGFRWENRLRAERSFGIGKDSLHSKRAASSSGPQVRLSLAALGRREWASTASYQQDPVVYSAELRPDVTLSTGDAFYLRASLITGLYQNTFDPLQPGLLLGGKAGEYLNWTAGGYRHFTRPSWNDLYWNPGGNPELKPESGWTLDASLALAPDWARFELSGWWTTVDDWILWSPTETGLWEASNLQTVRTTGLTAETGADLAVGRNGSAAFHTSYTWTNAKTRDGDQLLYVPLHQFGGSVFLSWKGLGLSWLQELAGRRYTSRDGEFLPAYAVSGFRAFYDLGMGRSYLRVSLGLDNVFDAYYESVLNRPLPGRSGMINLLLGWNSPVKKWQERKSTESKTAG